jgi:hypothetical protein
LAPDCGAVAYHTFIVPICTTGWIAGCSAAAFISFHDLAAM